jgi:hypothetical protein
LLKLSVIRQLIVCLAMHLVKEVQHVKEFFKARGVLSTTADQDQNLRNSFVNTLIVQLNVMPTFRPLDGTALSEVLKDSPYGEAGTAKIISVIDARLQSSSKTKAPQHTHDTQCLKQPWNYPVQQEWDTIFDKKKPWTMKMSVVVERLNLIGCTHPDEQTLKWVLAMVLVAHYDELPSHKVIYQKLQDLKDVFQTERKALFHEHILEYPPSAQQLPKDIYETAYPCSPPAPKELDGVIAVGENCIPLRRNSKLLKADVATNPGGQLTWDYLQRLIKPEVGHQVEVSSSLKRQGSSMSPAAPPSPPQDDAELCLYHEYQAKLAKLRHDRSAHARPMDVKSEPVEEVQHGVAPVQPTIGVPLNVLQQVDGSLMLSPKGRVFDIKKEADDDDAGAKEDTLGAKEDTLDIFASAAMRAFSARNAKRKTTTKEKTAAKKKVKPRYRCVYKKPAGSSVKSAIKCKDEEVDKKHIKTAMPKLPANGTNAKAVKYRGGVIYTSVKTKAFRVLTTRTDKYSEKGAKWGGAKPTMAAWNKAVGHIDTARKAS